MLCLVSEDHVDRIVKQWASERPEVDVSPMAVIGRLSRVSDEIRHMISDGFAQHDLEAWELTSWPRCCGMEHPTC